MYIKNKFLRFIISVFITIILYYFIVFAIEGTGDKSFYSILEAMFIFAVFGIFIVVPILIFFTYAAYQFFTIKEERSKKYPTIFKTMIVVIGIIALLYVAAMYTDLFG